MYNLIPIALAIFMILMKEKIMDYYGSFNNEYEKPLNRKIWRVRIIVSSSLLIAIGLINWIRTY